MYFIWEITHEPCVEDLIIVHKRPSQDQGYKTHVSLHTTHLRQQFEIVRVSGVAKAPCVTCECQQD